MLDELIVGILVNIAVMLVHLGATFLLVSLIHPYGSWLGGRPHVRLMLALLTAYAVLLTAHLVEVGIWAGLYASFQLVASPADAYYSAFMNYTTLGDSDALQGTHTRTLGPMTACSGILMFGWSTALLIYVLQGHLHQLIEIHRAQR
jgi:hypothetical protein